MNKYFLYAASVLALASCSSDDFLGENSGNGQNAANSVINFGGETGKITRAADIKQGAAAELLGKNFVLVGFKGSETTAANTNYAFDHYNVNYVDGTANTTESNTANWEYVNQSMQVKGADKSVNEGSLAQNKAKEQTIKYWDYSCASYDFIAFSMGKGYKTGETTDPIYATPTAVNATTLGTAAYTLAGDANTLGECYISDMKTVTKDKYSKTAVAMSFRHLTSKVRIALYETVPGYVISDVKFYNVETGGTGSEQGTLFGKFNNKGTLTVYFPTTGTKNATNADHNKAHVSFASDGSAEGLGSSKVFGKVNYNNQVENQITANAGYLSQTSTEPSYCGATAKEYLKVLPAEGKSMPANLRIDYKLTATDGTGEVINVKGATANVPAKYTEWKPGYAYTYIFKISQNTNGSTGEPGTDPSGLTAISFDAVVLEDEQNGLQETITTVSTPSITTYGFNSTDKKVTVNGDEYQAGTDIYATVHVPGATAEATATTEAPQKLYTVTIEDGAAKTINEASVANAIANGKKDNIENPTTWTVTDANGKNMVVTAATGTTEVTSVPTEDGHGLNVNALKWTGAANTYAVEYTDKKGTKSYKIVIVK